MNDWHEETDRAAVEKIAGHLREPVHLDETFDVRVMSAVHAEALARCDASHAERRASEEASRPWWSRKYAVHITPLTGLAMAATMLGVIYLGSMTSRSAATSEAARATAPAAAPADAQNVHFILVDGEARQVYLVGDFNGWSKTETPLVRAANGSAWTVSVPLTSGRHEYAFIVADEKGERWIADPLTDAVEDEFGTESSVVRVESGEEAVGAASS